MVTAMRASNYPRIAASPLHHVSEERTNQKGICFSSCIASLSLSVVVILRYYNNVDVKEERRENDLFGIVILYVALFTPFLHPSPPLPLRAKPKPFSPHPVLFCCRLPLTRPSRGGRELANPKEKNRKLFHITYIANIPIKRHTSS